jgi:hypothetical protein
MIPRERSNTLRIGQEFCAPFLSVSKVSTMTDTGKGTRWRTPLDFAAFGQSRCHTFLPRSAPCSRGSVTLDGSFGKSSPPVVHTA